MQGVEDGLDELAEDLQHEVYLFLCRDVPCELSIKNEY